jgi:hypothetical protein
MGSDAPAWASPDRESFGERNFLDATNGERSLYVKQYVVDVPEATRNSLGRVLVVHPENVWRIPNLVRFARANCIWLP